MPRSPRKFGGKNYRQHVPPFRKKSDAKKKASSLRKNGYNARVIKAKPGAGKAKSAPWMYLVYYRKS